MGTGAERSDPVVELKGATKVYPGTASPAVERLSFSLFQGETLAILGPSACGKTTILRLIAGFERPDEGEVLLRGRVVSGRRRMVAPEKRGVAMVFQDYALFPHLTVARNISFGLKKMDTTARERRVAETLELINMTEMPDRYPHQLSGGQQQRVALGRALAPRPVVVLLDEPFSNLDADMRVQMRHEVQAILRREAATTILVTHDQQEALSFADEVAVLNQGRLEQLGSPEEVYHQPATSFVAAFVGHASFIPAQLQGEEVITEVGRLSYNGNHVGSEVVVMVRPDDIQILPDEAGEATIISREFQGSQNLYTIRLASGWTVRSSQPSSTVYAVGARVKVMPSTMTHVVLFPARSKESITKDKAP
ncbi:MAG: ABC transporter ATP-binding protein [Dehalococcoidia bacterium]